MDTYHVLLGRPWQHDVDATHRGKENVYVFPWKGKRVAMRSILPAPKPAEEEEKPKFIFICNRGEFLVESKETKQWVYLLVKEEVTPPTKVLEKIKSLLEESKSVIHDEIPEGLLPMKNIQPYFDFLLEQVYQSFTLPDKSQGE